MEFMNLESHIVIKSSYTKKTEKAPKREIDKAVKLKEEYKNGRK